MLPQDLTPEQAARLREQVRRHYRNIKRAYLARKPTEHLSEVPLYVLGVEPESSSYSSSNEESETELMRNLLANVEFSGETFVVILNRNFKKTKKALSQLEGAVIYGE